ncbi:DUF3152 domain-containing protein [Streptomyces avicenniae]|uniref:DUF3152 domain-containing protein n=1 Tax=Streptomyces avicenniae TaxID=500153 RepID=UPI000DA60F6B|nr:DUF3152 domain-containing protein [Streptomyces avicenniae]
MRSPAPPLAPVPSRSRNGNRNNRNRKGSRRARRARRTVPLSALTAVLVIAAVAVAGVLAFRGGDDTPPPAGASAAPPSAAASPPAEPAPDTPAPDTPAPDTPSADTSPPGAADGEPSADGTTVEVLETGPGTFTTAPGDGGPVGGRAVLTYRVEIEDGIGLDPAATAAEVHAVLGDPRGWTNEGDTGFRPADDGATPDFTVRVATPGTVDALCGEYGLNTRGETNCSIGQVVVVNLRRWVQGSPQFDGPIGDYRALIVNHEVGHFLGHGHEGCPGEGATAPAMMQQIMGLDGCVANAWPYGEDGAYLSGPSVP